MEFARSHSAKPLPLPFCGSAYLCSTRFAKQAANLRYINQSKLYRKFTADHIFSGKEMLSHDTVLITDPLGVIVDLVDKKEAGGDIEVLNGLLSPGFINCHCHLELSHMKGMIPKQTGLVDFVFKVVTERHFDEAQVIAGIEKGEFEMLENGIVGVGDICNNVLTIGQKAEGRLNYHNFIEASGFPAEVAVPRFSRAKEIYDAYSSALSSNSIAPHAPYSVSPELFAMINEFPNNNLVTIHNQETASENEFFQNGSGDLYRMFEKMGIDISFFKPSGRSSLQTWLPHINKAQSIILVHNVATSAEDITFAQLLTTNYQLPTFFCLCPNANLYISNTLPDIRMLISNHCDIVLGTDSLASNDQLCILEEIKTLKRNFPELQLPTMLRWATSQGAKALRMEDELGSFERGTMPGIVLINEMDGMELTDRSKARRVL